MKISSNELKSSAKSILLGRYALPAGAFALTLAISFAVNFAINLAFQGTSTITLILSTFCTWIFSLLLGLLSVGMSSIILNLSRGKEYDLKNLFFVFTHQPDRVILLNILISLIAIGCMLPGIVLLIFGILLNAVFIELTGILFMIGGIVVTILLELSYSQVYFIYLDDYRKGVLQIMRESWEMMKGNKGRMFYLQISFIGISLLSILTFFIGHFWLEPYMVCTYAQFYRNLRREI